MFICDSGSSVSAHVIGFLLFFPNRQSIHSELSAVLWHPPSPDPSCLQLPEGLREACLPSREAQRSMHSSCTLRMAAPASPVLPKSHATHLASHLLLAHGIWPFGPRLSGPSHHPGFCLEDSSITAQTYMLLHLQLRYRPGAPSL